MAVEEYEYNGRIWQPHLTTTGVNSFYHAVFGAGKPSVDKEASFRRKCLLNFLAYMKDKDKPEQFEKFLATISEDEDIENVLEPYLQAVSASEHAVSVKEIPLISALHKVRVVLFFEDCEDPKIFHPEEDLLGNYPWKTKNELREVVVQFNGSGYTRLQFIRYDDTSNEPDSVLEESTNVEEKKNTFYTETYPKLTGSAGVRGILYQIDLSTIFLLNATSKLDSFRLSTENERTGKFDDVDLELQSKKSFFLQAKHKQTKTIYQNDLFQISSDSDFSLAKYYFSYQDFRNDFDVETLYLCTNTNVSFPKKCSYFSKHRIEDDDLLHISDMENFYYKFNKDIITQFRDVAVEYKEKNMPDKALDADVLSDSRIESFFSKFRLVPNYPVKGGTGAAIENLLSHKKYCDPLQTRNCAKYLNDKMLEWFDNKKGRYLNQNTLRIFLSEFRSNNFCEKMYNLDIHLKGEHFNYCRGKRLVHIEFRGSYVLNMVKVYYGLYINKKKYLFISPMKEKEEEEEAQLEMVRAFKDSFHEVLVACFKVSDGRVRDVAAMLTDILTTSTYKRIILIASKSDSLVSLLKGQNEDEHIPLITEMSITYEGQLWEICPTKDDCNSFFHAVFGEKTSDDDCYNDEMASNRRMHWTTFLSYYETKPRPDLLRETLLAYFEEHGWNLDSDANYKDYIKDVESGRQIRQDELETIASLENVAIVLFRDHQPVPEIIRPVPEMLESYPLTSGVELSDAVVVFQGSTYSKLIPTITESVNEGTKDITKFRRYPGFIAGILYQINLQTVVLLNALEKFDIWRLSADNASAEYFDDVVLEWGEQNNAFLLQAKRRQRHIYDGDLLGNKYSGFSLCKYFLAYQKLKSKFKVENVVLCTSTMLSLKSLGKYINQSELAKDHLLYLEGLESSLCVTFTDEFAEILFKKVYEHEPSQRNRFTEEDIKAFLKDFQLIILPWEEKALERAIEDKIFSMGLSGKYDKTDYARYLNKKVTQWYDKSSRYLTPLDAKVIFCGLKSDKLVEKLNNLEIEFKPDKLSLPTANRVLHLVPQNDVLSLLRVCKTLQNRQSQVLFLSTRDSVDNQKLMAEAFESGKYSYLVVYVAQLLKDEYVQKLCDKIVRALEKFKQKKVILIGYQGDRLAEQLRKYNSKVFETVEDNITFTDFSEKSQEELLEKAILSCEASL